MKKIKNCYYGNPRYVIHFLKLLTSKEINNLSIFEGYDLAIKKAKKLGGKRYRGKDFGGGIVFSTWNTTDLLKKIGELRNEI